MTELNDKAYDTYTILKRAMPLMEGLESATDEAILKVCEEIAEYLEERLK